MFDVSGWSERPKLCECVSYITEAVRHHAYVFLFHAVGSAAGTASKESEVEGWGRRAADEGAMIDGVLKEMVLWGRARAIGRADTIVADAVAAEHRKLVMHVLDQFQGNVQGCG